MLKQLQRAFEKSENCGDTVLPDKSIGQKFVKNAKNSQFGEFLKTTAFSQTVLPDRSLLIGQELLKNAIFEKKN